MNIELSPAQAAAVHAAWEGCVSLVVSVAGSGKTTVLTHRVYWIAKELVAASRLDSVLLCVCFNKSAAIEMSERVQAMIAAEGTGDFIAVSKRPVKGKVAIEVRTFHSLGLFILQSASMREREAVGLRPGRLVVLSGKELRELMRDALLEAGLLVPAQKKGIMMSTATKFLQKFSRFKGLLSDTLSINCHEGGKLRQLPSLLGKDQLVFQLYMERLQGCNAVDFADMTSKAAELLRNKDLGVVGRFAGRYAAVLVDEFQDASPSNFETILAFSKNSTSLTFVGDDDQRIYSFRMIDSWFLHVEVEHLLRGRQLTKFALSENRRCTGSVVRAAGSVISRNTARIDKQFRFLESRGVGTPARIIGCATEALEIRYLISAIHGLMSRDCAAAEPVLVLCRLNSQLKTFRAAVDDAGIPTSGIVTRGSSRKMIGEKAASVLSLLTIICPSADSVALCRSITTLCPSLRQTTLDCAFDSIERRREAQMSTSNNLKACDPDFAESPFNMRPQSTRRPLKKASSAQLLSDFRRWFEAERDAENHTERVDDSDIESLLQAFRCIDAILTGMKDAVCLEDLVQCAQKILISFALDGAEPLLTQDPIPGVEELEADDAKGVVGLDIIIEAARQLDKEMHRFEQCKDIPYARASRSNSSYKVVDENDDTDDAGENDFFSLLSRDCAARVEKRRRKLGVSATPLKQENPAQRRKCLVEKLEVLCQRCRQSFRAFDNGAASKQTSKDFRVVFSTIHKAKGCEMSHVFLCGADDDSFPHLMRTRREDFPPQEVSLQSANSQEERRMFYVAMTRAKHELHVTYADKSGRASKDSHPRQWQSPFIQELISGVDADPRVVLEHFVYSEEDIPDHFRAATSQLTRVRKDVAIGLSDNAPNRRDRGGLHLKKRRRKN